MDLSPKPGPDMDLDCSPEPSPDPDADANLMAQMGFSIFGHQKKKNHPQSNSSSPPPPSRHSKRQKHNPSTKHASGANNTPLRPRQQHQHQQQATGKPITRQSPMENAAASTANAASIANASSMASIPSNDQDPHYEDSPIADSASIQGQQETSHGQGLHLNNTEREESALDLPYTPPSVQRLSGGDCAFFRPSFVVEDPWRGMVGVRLPD